MVIDVGAQFLGFTTFVKAVPDQPTFEAHTSLAPGSTDMDLDSPLVPKGVATVRFKPNVNRILRRIDVLGQPLVSGSPSILQWSLRETTVDGIPIEPDAPARIVLQAIGSGDALEVLQTPVSMQDSGGNVRNVMLEKDKYYQLTLTPTSNGWEGPADESQALPATTNDGLFEIISTTIEQLGSTLNRRLQTELVTVPVGDDPDGDLVPDFLDSCTETANGNERDTDGDGYGNGCDADFDQNCIINFVDLGIMRAFFFAPGNLITDLNGDLQTNFLDLGILRTAFFSEPGPSALTQQCSQP